MLQEKFQTAGLLVEPSALGVVETQCYPYFVFVRRQTPYPDLLLY